jgi:hypothetical protein
MQTVDIDTVNKAPLVTNGTSDTNTSVWFVDALTAEQQRAFGSVTIYQCPTRRSGVKYVDNNPGGNENNNGPRGDYAIVSSFNPNTVTSLVNENWFKQVSLYGTATKNWFLQRNCSPLRISIVEWASDAEVGEDDNPLGGNNGDKKWIVRWRPRDTFSYWRDGISNQIVVGEKFIPLKLIDKIPAKKAEAQWDGGILNANAAHANMNTARAIYNTQACIKRSPKDILDSDLYGTGTDPNANEQQAVFGGSHTGISMFLLGDGSVRPISATINWTTLHYLGKVDDGEPVSLE